MKDKVVPGLPTRGHSFLWVELKVLWELHVIGVTVYLFIWY